MNKNFDECMDYINTFKNFRLPRERTVVICPPDYVLDNFASVIHKKKNCFVGAQDSAIERDGSMTGELSATMIKSTGAKYVILGHSERRNKLGETSGEVNKKVKLAVEAGLVPIVCVGEKLEETKKRKSVILNQLKESLKGVDISKIIIAYEPIWAIGTGKTCDVKDIQFVHQYIKSKLSTKNNFEPVIVYGGSVKPSNAGEILSLECVDGVLVGGSSLDPYEFYKIVKS
ncbi:MAG: triose-phosphate isomerase [Clostridia bacterium]|nr:triose-phosphate isomerase [Clostridia bacterium]